MNIYRATGGEDPESLIDEQAEEPKCACLEYIGDNPECKQHGHLYRAHEFGSPEWFAGIPEQEF